MTKRGKLTVISPGHTRNPHFNGATAEPPDVHRVHSPVLRALLTNWNSSLAELFENLSR